MTANEFFSIVVFVWPLAFGVLLFLRIAERLDDDGR